MFSNWYTHSELVNTTLMSFITLADATAFYSFFDRAGVFICNFFGAWKETVNLQDHVLVGCRPFMCLIGQCRTHGQLIIVLAVLLTKACKAFSYYSRFRLFLALWCWIIHRCFAQIYLYWRLLKESGNGMLSFLVWSGLKLLFSHGSSRWFFGT